MRDFLAGNISQKSFLFKKKFLKKRTGTFLKSPFLPTFARKDASYSNDVFRISAIGAHSGNAALPLPYTRGHSRSDFPGFLPRPLHSTCAHFCI